jgi:transposase
MKNKKLSIKPGGSESKLSNIQTKEIIAHLEAKTYLKVLEICSYVKKTYNIKYSVAGMTNWLKRNNFTFRKPHAFPSKANSEKQTEFAVEYEKLKRKTPLMNFLRNFCVFLGKNRRLAKRWC